MPLPPISTLVACGSIITSIKSSWELSRMLKRKKLQKGLAEDSDLLLETLSNAHLCGDMSKAEFDHWYDKFLAALAEEDIIGLKKIWIHLDMVRRRTANGDEDIPRRQQRQATEKSRPVPSKDSSSKPQARTGKARRPPPLDLSAIRKTNSMPGKRTPLTPYAYSRGYRSPLHHHSPRIRHRGTGARPGSSWTPTLPSYDRSTKSGKVRFVDPIVSPRVVGSKDTFRSQRAYRRRTEEDFELRVGRHLGYRSQRS